MIPDSEFQLFSKEIRMNELFTTLNLKASNQGKMIKRRISNYNLVHTMKIILIESKVHGNLSIKVDDEDYEYLNQWTWTVYKTKSGAFYAVRNSYSFGGHKKRRTTKILMSRLIMKTPVDLVCDHKDHDTLNNQKYNLRNCTRSENNMNRDAKKNGKLLGVFIYPTGKYYSKIKTGGKHFFLGSFPATPCGKLFAAITYDIAAVKYHGEFANCNFK